MRLMEQRQALQCLSSPTVFAPPFPPQAWSQQSPVFMSIPTKTHIFLVGITCGLLVLSPHLEGKCKMDWLRVSRLKCCFYISNAKHSASSTGTVPSKTSCIWGITRENTEVGKSFGDNAMAFHSRNNLYRSPELISHERHGVPLVGD